MYRIGVPLSPKINVMKPSFGTLVSRMVLGSFVDINIVVMKYYLFFVSSYSPFF